MISSGAFTVFVLGLRHGADPDHLAAIDNVTRNSYERTPLLSRFVGTLFASGHAVMVLAISALVGLAGSRFASQSHTIETIGTWISILVLVAIAAVNLQQIRRGDLSRIHGAKTRLLPRRLREGSSALLAVPIGLLFGFGFETSSQIATYAVVFGIDAGITGAIMVGAMFCLGMICTDTLDSVLVHRLISFRSERLPQIMRIWLISVTALALFVAAYEFAQVLGWVSPVSDLIISAILVTAIGAVFAYVYANTRRPLPQPPSAAPSLGEIKP